MVLSQPTRELTSLLTPATPLQVPSPPALLVARSCPASSLSQCPLPLWPGHPYSSHICSTELLSLTIFLQKMWRLWLLLRLAIHRPELVTEGLLHCSRRHHLLRRHFRTCNNLTITKTANQHSLQRR